MAASLPEPLPFNITISSQTATIQYSPARDGDITAGWNVSYSLGLKDTGIGFPQGVGIDSHQTTHDGATMQMSWVGTAIYLYGQASSASYTITLDGSSSTSAGISLPPGGLLGSYTGLSYGNHTLTLTTHGNGQVGFQYAEMTIGIGYTGTTVQNTTILAVNTGSGIPAPNDFFKFQSTKGPNSWQVENAMKTLLPDGTLVPVPQQMLTTTKGDLVSFTLSHTTAFFLWGADNVDHGTKTVSVIPASNPSLGRSMLVEDISSALDFKQLLYWESGLDRDQNYTVMVTQIGSPSAFSFSSLDIIDGGSAPAGSGGNTTVSGGGGGGNTGNAGGNNAANGGGSGSGGGGGSGSGDNGTNKDSQDGNLVPSSRLSTGAIAGIAVAGAVVVLLILAVLGFLLYRRRRKLIAAHDTSADLIDEPVRDTLLPTSGGMQQYSPVPASSYASITGPILHPAASSTVLVSAPTNDSSPGPMHEIDAGRVTVQTLPPQYEGSWAPTDQQSSDPASPSSQSFSTSQPSQPSIGISEKRRRLVVMTYENESARA